jgi:hypothetical protein
MAKYYADLADLGEDDRITAIGNSVMKAPASSGDKPLMTAFIVEDHAKADRYIEKLQGRFPGIRIIDRFDGPVKDVVTVRVGAPLR